MFQQHDAQWIADGSPGAGHILIFNNGLDRGYSTIDEIAPPVDAAGRYRLDAGKTFGPDRPLWTYEATPRESFYSAEISGAQRLPNGNTLICAGVRGVLFEVTPSGQKVWEYVNPMVRGGILAQGEESGKDQRGHNWNAVFKILRYAASYPGLAGRDLTPGGVIELPASERGKTGLDRLDAREEDRRGRGEGRGGRGGGRGGRGGYDPPPPREEAELLRSGTRGRFAIAPGVVTNTSTGLMWQQQDGGETTWERAQRYCAELSLAGFHDWRLPSVYESFGLLDHKCLNPALDPAVFARTDAQYWWTKDTRPDDRFRVWVTNAGGGAGPHPATETISAGGDRRYHARCVRVATPIQRPAPRYVAEAGGVVTDRWTGLMWQQQESAESLPWDEATRYAKNSSTGGYRDWRLPTIAELQSLVDISASDPALAAAAFPHAAAGEYWSATRMVNHPEQAWIVDFRLGIVTYRADDARLRVRPVRRFGASRGTPSPSIGPAHILP